MELGKVEVQWPWGELCVTSLKMRDIGRRERCNYGHYFVNFQVHVSTSRNQVASQGNFYDWIQERRRNTPRVPTLRILIIQRCTFARLLQNSMLVAGWVASEAVRMVHISALQDDDGGTRSG